MSLNSVTLTIAEQDAAGGAGAGNVVIAPTSAVTAAGVTVVSQTPVVRALGGSPTTVSLVASDNAGTSPAAGFWAYSITLPGGLPQLYLVNFANGSTQRLDQLTPVFAQTTYGPPAGSGITGPLDLPAAIVPKVVTLADAATITPDWSQGNFFKVALGGNRLIANPVNPAEGQTIQMRLVQDGTGSRVPTWGNQYNWGSGGSAPVPSTAAGSADYVAFAWDADKSEAAYLGAAFPQGF